MGFRPARFGVLFCSVVDTHLKLLGRVVSGASFLTGGVVECDLAHCRSVSVLCMMYKIICNAMHPLNGALPEPYVPVSAHIRMLMQYRRTFIPLSVSLWNELGDPVFNGVGLARFQSRANAILFA